MNMIRHDNIFINPNAFKMRWYPHKLPFGNVSTICIYTHHGTVKTVPYNVR